MKGFFIKDIKFVLDHKKKRYIMKYQKILIILYKLKLKKLIKISLQKHIMKILNQTLLI